MSRDGECVVTEWDGVHTVLILGNHGSVCLWVVAVALCSGMVN